MSSENRVVITGIGMVTPFGNDVGQFWNKILSGQSSIKKIKRIDVSSFPSQLAGEVDHSRVVENLPPRYQKIHSRSSLFAIKSAIEAVKDAGLNECMDVYRTFVQLGVGAQSFEPLEENLKRLGFADGYDPGYNPLSLFQTFTNGPSCLIARHFGIKGDIETISTGCSSAHSAFGSSYKKIKHGMADVIITGGVDTPITEITLNSFCAAKLLLTENNPDALRPFDEGRDKPVLSEGSSVFILEDLDHAVGRNAKIYAEVIGYETQNENYSDSLGTDKQGRRWGEVMQKACESVDDIYHVNAHAPSDKVVDKCEIKAIKLALHQKVENAVISSIKGAIGAGFSAAGSMQIAASILTAHTGEIPPNCNFNKPDEEFDYKFIPEALKKQNKVRNVLCNGHAIGGTNCAILLRNYQGY